MRGISFLVAGAASLIVGMIQIRDAVALSSDPADVVWWVILAIAGTACLVASFIFVMKGD